MNSIKRGALIVFEGIDKSGKSTHSKRLVNSLQTEGYKAKLMSFPDRTTNTGNLINEYLKNSDYNLNNQTIHLLFSANRWENVDRIKALLFDGINLVIDRYSYSGIAYSVAKNMCIDWCKKPENGLPMPDVVFYLRLNDEEIERRYEANNANVKERYETVSMQKLVSEIYKGLIDNSWCVINANDTIKNVESQILKKSFDVIREAEKSNLRYLNF